VLVLLAAAGVWWWGGKSAGGPPALWQEEDAMRKAKEEKRLAEQRAEEAERRAQEAEDARKQAEEEAANRLREWEERLAKVEQESQRSLPVVPSSMDMALSSFGGHVWETKVVDLGGGVTLEMVHCLGKGEDFWMGKYEVTQEQWERVMGDNPSHFGNKPKNPVESVSWNDCQEFTEKLNGRPEVKASGLTFRLPTEEEWEKACLAGAPAGADYCKLADGTQITAGNLSRVAYYGHDWDDGPSSVGGGREPNAWGLYDMHGNVWEWTSTAESDARVCRGGGFGITLGNCSSGDRGGDNPDSAFRNVGLRLAASAGRTAAR